MDNPHSLVTGPDGEAVLVDLDGLTDDQCLLLAKGVDRIVDGADEEAALLFRALASSLDGKAPAEENEHLRKELVDAHDVLEEVRIWGDESLADKAHKTLYESTSLQGEEGSGDV